MTLTTDLAKFSQEVEEKDDPPRSITVSETEEGVIEVSPTWIEERESGLLVPTAGDSSEQTVDYPKSYYEEISEGELYEKIEAVFNDIKSVITVSDEVDLDSFSFSVLSKAEGGTFENPFVPEWATFGAMARGVIEYDEYTESGQNLLETILDEVNEMDESVSVDDFSTVEVHFSDWSVCELSSIGGYIQTAYPHRYYEGVESVDEYIETVADDTEELQSLRNKDTYEVYFKFADFLDDDYEIPEDLRELAESIMSTRIENAVESEVEWYYESESIMFEDGVESTSFYLRVPFRHNG